MSTNGTLGFKFGGKTVRTYNHSDSYVSGLGVDVLNYARLLDTPAKVAAAREAFAALTIVDEMKSPTPEQRAALHERWHQEVSSGSDWYAVLRSTQGDPAAMIASGYLSIQPKATLDWNYYNYLLDFDKGEFVVYLGGTPYRYAFDALPTDEQLEALDA